MRNTKVAYRYAKSILQLAEQRNEGDRVEADFGVVLDALKANRELRVFLNSPVVKSDVKEKTLLAVFGNHVGELVKGFIKILTTKGREALLLEIAESYIEQTRLRKGIMSAKVVLASPLDGVDKEAFNALVKAMNGGGEVRITEEVNPDIIGGFILKVEDKMVDASVAGQLKALRRNYSKNLYEASI